MQDSSLSQRGGSHSAPRFRLIGSQATAIKVCKYIQTWGAASISITTRAMQSRVLPGYQWQKLGLLSRRYTWVVAKQKESAKMASTSLCYLKVAPKTSRFVPHLKPVPQAETPEQAQKDFGCVERYLWSLQSHGAQEHRLPWPPEPGIHVASLGWQPQKPGHQTLYKFSSGRYSCSGAWQRMQRQCPLYKVPGKDCISSYMYVQLEHVPQATAVKLRKTELLGPLPLVVPCG